MSNVFVYFQTSEELLLKKLGFKSISDAENVFTFHRINGSPSISSFRGKLVFVTCNRDSQSDNNYIQSLRFMLKSLFHTDLMILNTDSSRDRGLPPYLASCIPGYKGLVAAVQNEDRLPQQNKRNNKQTNVQVKAVNSKPLNPKPPVTHVDSNGVSDAVVVPDAPAPVVGEATKIKKKRVRGPRKKASAKSSNTSTDVVVKVSDDSPRYNLKKLDEHSSESSGEERKLIAKSKSVFNSLLDISDLPAEKTQSQIKQKKEEAVEVQLPSLSMTKSNQSSLLPANFTSNLLDRVVRLKKEQQERLQGLPFDPDVELGSAV